MRDPHRPHGAALIVRIWFESPPSPFTLRARIVYCDDPTEAEAESLVVASTGRALVAIKAWLVGCVATARSRAGDGLRRR